MHLNKPRDRDTLQHIASKDTQKAVNRSFTTITDTCLQKAQFTANYLSHNVQKK